MDWKTDTDVGGHHMTRDDIIRMAREAWGLHFICESDVTKLERFAALVAAAEREACAKVCDETAKSLDDGGLQTMAYGARYSATAIRARKSHENN